MKRFLKKTLLFSIPLVCWVVIVVVVDPFNYFSICHLVDITRKEKNAERLNPLIYHTIDCANNPAENMLIGDSRTRALPVDEIEKLSGIRYKKMVAMAAKLNEIFQLVYYANECKKLKRVVIGINFSMFNKYGYADRVNYVRDMQANPVKYIFNRNVAEASYYIIKSKITGHNLKDVPEGSREQFWQWNLRVTAAHFYSKYQFPDKMYEELFKLDSFAVANKIELTFIVVPLSREFHDKLVGYGLENEEKRFKGIISHLSSRVIDYDYDNVITASKDNFDDPIHYNKKMGILIADEIWGDKLEIGKVLNVNKPVN